MMTEDEAQDVWCPFARVVEIRDGKALTNRGVYAVGPDVAHCLGAGCMAWRWDHDRRIQGHSPGPDWIELTEDGITIVGMWVRKVPVGFCGLAGRP